jgi:hypothetical protein
MKFKKFLLVELLIIIAIIAMITPVKAQGLNGAFIQTRWKYFTNAAGTGPYASVIVTNATAPTINSPAVALYRGRGLAIMPTFIGTNAGTANVILAFNVSADGTNWSTTTPFSYTLPMNGTTAVIGYTNFPSTLLDNVAYLRLAYISNAHTANITVSNVTWSVFP